MLQSSSLSTVAYSVRKRLERGKTREDVFHPELDSPALMFADDASEVVRNISRNSTTGLHAVQDLAQSATELFQILG